MEAHCKESLLQRQPPATIEFVTPLIDHLVSVPNITLTRRHNVLALFQQHAARALAAGASPKGLEQAFAATLQISPSMWSQIKASRPIGDKLARQIEALSGQAVGWLDQPDAAPDDMTAAPAPGAHMAPAATPSRPLTPTEEAFLTLALTAWRSTDHTARQALRRQLEALIQTQQPA